MAIYGAALHFDLWYALFIVCNKMNRCIFYLVCESSCVVGDKMEMGLEQVQVAVMHILKEQTHSISSGSTQSEGSFWVMLLYRLEFNNIRGLNDFFFLNLSLNSKIFKGHTEGKLKTRCGISPRDRALIYVLS